MRRAVLFPFEDTEALQPKPKTTKLALESRLFTPGACVNKQDEQKLGLLSIQSGSSQSAR